MVTIFAHDKAYSSWFANSQDKARSPGEIFPPLLLFRRALCAASLLLEAGAALEEPLALSCLGDKAEPECAERGPTPAARAPCRAQLSARQRQTAGLGRFYLVLLSGISNIIKLAVCP